MNQYNIYEEIGRGKHSVVYKGRKKKTIEYVAIKSVEKSYKQKVMNEVRILHNLVHPNILRFFNWYETSNHIWLIVEYCTGGDLLNLVMQDKRLPESTVHAFGMDLLCGLQFIHSRGIIYCDLKPSNVLIDENGCLKLCDFGLAQSISEVRSGASQGVQPKRGTPCYMAPELFQDDGVHNFSSDFWALGCVLYELATGRPPFVSNSFTDLMNQILYGQFQPIEGASPELGDLIAGLLQKHPARRFNWTELRSHAFWREKLAALPIPEQPAFDAYLRQLPEPTAKSALDKGGKPTSLSSGSPAEEINGDEDAVLREPVSPPAPQGRVGNPGGEQVNVMRLSMTVKKNLDKEHGDMYRQQQSSGQTNQDKGDIELKDHDAELEFEEHRSQDDEESESRGQQEGDGDNDDLESDEADHANDQPLGPMQSESNSHEAVVPSAVPRALSESVCLGGAPVPLLQLLIHQSDNIVKPIVLNRRIEKSVNDVVYDERQLPLRPVSLQEMLSMSQQDLENFLTLLFKSIGGQTSVAEKLNTLAYLETLCEDTQAANMLVNSALMTLFVKMLSKCKSIQLKSRLCSIMGLLVRHATFLEPALNDSGIIQVITDVLRDKNDKLKRRAMATLGELLFYIATQQAQDSTPPSGSQWAVPQATVTLVVRCLKAGEDETVQHYACKTLENIAAQSLQYSQKFASPESLGHLLNLFMTSKNDQLKQTAISALARLVRQIPALINLLLDKAGFKFLLFGLADSNPKVQQAAVNLLNYSLLDLNVRGQAALSEDKTLLPIVMKLLEHSHPVLRAKALLSLLLLVRLSTKWLLVCCDLKLVPLVDRLVKDKDSYVHQCALALLHQVSELVPSITRQICLEVEKVSSKKYVASANTKQKGQLGFISILLHVMTSPTFRTRAVNSTLLQDLSLCLSHVEVVASVVLPDFKRIVLLIVEALSQHAAVLVAHQDAVLSHLLPTLCSLLDSENGDTRFLCLKMLSDVLVLYINHSNLYDPSSREASMVTATRKIDDLIGNYVLPKYKFILSDEDPLPLYGLKTLSAILDRNPAFVRNLQQLQLTGKFLEFLQLEHSNNNIHNIKIVLKLVQSPDVPLKQLYSLGLGQKVASVIAYAFDNAVDSFFDPLLELLASMLRCARGCQEDAAVREEHKHVLACLQVLAHLARHPEGSVSENSSFCISELCREFAACEVPQPRMASLLNRIADEGFVDVARLRLLVEQL